jgi:hypothetical protein
MKDIMERISPLPWHTRGCGLIVDANNQAVVAPKMMKWPKRQAPTAAHIVHATKLYPELVGAFFDMMWIYQGKPYPAEKVRIDEILAILAKCKAGAE